jgi:hypothetical protein
VSISIYGLLAADVLVRGILVATGLSDGVVHAAAWFVVGYFFIGIGMNLASRSKSKRAVMSPAVAVLCGLCAVVAAS